MPKLIKADMRQVVVFQKKREMGGYIVLGKRLAGRPPKDKVVFLIVRAVLQYVLFRIREEGKLFHNARVDYKLDLRCLADRIRADSLRARIRAPDPTIGWG